MTGRSWAVVGVPSSAAAHWPGLEKAPAALRGAGIVDVLRSAGLTVADDGDLPAVVWRSHRRPGSPNDVARVVDVVTAARDRLRPILEAGRVPLVLGGECTVTMALLSAAFERHGYVGLVYVDGGQDLMTVADHPEEPILDAMGVAHMLDLPGVSRALSGVGPRRPLLDPRHLVFFAFSDAEEDEHGQVPAVRIGAAEVMASPEAAAGPALDSVAQPTALRTRSTRPPSSWRDGGPAGTSARGECPHLPRPVWTRNQSRRERLRLSGGAGLAGNCSSALQDVVDNRSGRFREAGCGTVAAACMKEN